MIIPGITASQPIHTGSTGPEAQPADFGSGIASAVGQLHQAINESISTVERVAIARKEKQHLDDLAWVGESTAQEKNYINKWMADPENNTKETFADDLNKLTKDRIQAYTGATTSTRALQMFRGHMQQFGSERYEAALQQGARTKLQNSALAIDTQSGYAMEDYRQLKDAAWIDRDKGLQDSVNNTERNIDESFGVIAPTLATKLKEKLHTDAAYATMNDNADLAREFINSSTTLDEHTRHTIMEQIDQATRSKSAVELEAFNQVRQDRLTSVFNGKTRDKLDLTLYQPYYTRDKAQAQKMRDDALIDTYNRANDTISKMQPWDSAYQVREATQLRKGVTTAQDSDVADIVEKRVHESAVLQDRNPISWLQQNNPIVKNALKVAQDSTDQGRVQALGELYDVTLKYQGRAPSDATSDERKMYMDRATNDRHLMTSEEAEVYADTINKGTPKQMLESISTVMARYSDPEHQNIAFNDLVTMPKGNHGIKQEYQLAFLNRDAHWVDNYLGAIQNSESLKKVDPEKIVDYEKALRVDPNFMAFSHSMMGDNFQRGNQVEGFKNGILAYAYALSTQDHMNPKAAITTASRMLIGNELAFTTVHGATMMIARDRGPGKPQWTDNDAYAIGKRLEESLNYIDPGQVKLTDAHNRNIFPALAQAGSEQVRLQGMMNFLREKAFFQTSADGKSVSLYASDGNHSFELRDKQDRAFIINFDDLMSTPLSRMTKRRMESDFPGVQGQMIDYPEPIYEKPGRYVTNWPVAPSYIKHVNRGAQSRPAGMDPNFKALQPAGYSGNPDDR